MRNRLGRWRHLAVLVPLGVVVGAVVGLGFGDVLFAVGVGAAFGIAFGLLLAWRAPNA